jgi:hypothetical protein
MLRKNFPVRRNQRRLVALENLELNIKNYKRVLDIDKKPEVIEEVRKKLNKAIAIEKILKERIR